MTSLHRSAVLDVLDDAFFVFDETGAVLEWNQAVIEVGGYPEDELSSMTLTDLFPADDAERVRAAITEALETDEATVEADLVTDADERIPYRFRVQQLPDADGTARFASVGRDVSDRWQAESERRKILDRMVDGFFSIDSDWRVTYTNEQGARILSNAIGRDLRPDELDGLHLWEAIPEAVDTTFYEKYHEAMETQEPVTFEEYYDPLDAWFDVRAYPSETGLSVYVYDATERHRRQEALETRERVLRSMHDIIADRDRSFTEQVEALLALGRDELGTDYGSLSSIEGEDYVFEIVDAADDSIQAGDVVPLSATNCELAASSEETVVLGDVARDAPGETDRAGYAEWGISCYIGAPVYVDDEVYGTFCFYDTDPLDGQFSEWEVTLVDLLSRWVSYELQRQRSNERLERQNERLERFASVISHDLRNPLNVAQGRIELARERHDDDNLADAADAVDRSLALIDDLLTLAREGEDIDEVDDVDLAAVIDGCWQNVRATDASLVVETERTIRADSGRTKQLLSNLLRNAIDHGGRGVTITVGDLEDGFYVADDGPGIPADERDRVFEGGYSTADDGIGLGLDIVRKIAEAHGWDVGVTESETGGARFEITGVTTAE